MKVEDKAIVAHILGGETAVEHAVMKQEDITFAGGELPVICMENNIAGPNADQFPFFVPVNGHAIMWMGWINIVISSREIQGSVLYFFAKRRNLILIFLASIIFSILYIILINKNYENIYKKFPKKINTTVIIDTFLYSLTLFNKVLNI